jgi:hypothetical protein
MWAHYILKRFNHITELLSSELNDLICASHFIYSIMCMPKNFAFELQKIFILSNLTLYFIESVPCLSWNDTAVFSVFSMRLFAQNHECESFITLFIFCWRICPFSAVTKRLVSSANKTVLVSLKFRAFRF